MRTYFRKTRTRNDVPQQAETAWYVTVTRRTKKSDPPCWRPAQQLGRVWYALVRE